MKVSGTSRLAVLTVLTALLTVLPSATTAYAQTYNRNSCFFRLTLNRTRISLIGPDASNTRLPCPLIKAAAQTYPVESALT